MTTINAAHAPPAEPVVFSRGGKIYANSRDLAAHYGRDHNSVVQAIKRAIKRRPDLLLEDGDVVETLSRGSHGRAGVSYDLSYEGFAMIGDLVIGREGRKAGRRESSYRVAYDEKRKALWAAEAALPRTVEQMIQALNAGADMNDLNMMEAMARIWMNEARSSLDKALELKKRNDALTQDNGHLTLENAELVEQVEELQMALCEKRDEAVSPSPFRH